jgi:hypothetical protein
MPPAVLNLLLSVRIKLAARAAGVLSLTLNAEQLIVRSEPAALYDRVSLYHRYGMEARISTNVLRIPRGVLGPDWIGAVRQTLDEMIALRESLSRPQAVEA